MNELQRQQYLDALGIDTYMPRVILPYSPIPIACDISFLPETFGVDASSVMPSAIQSMPTPVTVALSQLTNKSAGGFSGDVLSVLADKPQSSVVASESVAALVDKLAEKVKIPSAAPAFALSIWRVSDSLLVVDSRQAQLALPTEPLLINILVALGYPRQPLPKADVVRWPMLSGPGVDQSEASAREMLEAYLDSRLMPQPGTRLLLMGADAARYVLPVAQMVENTVPFGQSFMLEALQANAIVVPSLADMLLAPASKRLTWQAIQPLVLPIQA